MSANIRATPPPFSSGRQGRTLKVVGSGMAIMSDSSMALKPVIDEPSNPIPPSNASSSSSALIENDFSWPRMSVNHRRMKRIPRSETSALTSSAVCGRSPGGDIGGRLANCRRGRGGPPVQPESDPRSAPPLVRDPPRGSGDSGSVHPAVGPVLELGQRRSELAAAVGQRVLDSDGTRPRDLALDDAAALELLHAL